MEEPLEIFFSDAADASRRFLLEPELGKSVAREKPNTITGDEGNASAS
jgi:hypothetical protein